MEKNRILKWLVGVGIIFLWVSVFGEKGLLSLSRLSELKKQKITSIENLSAQNVLLRQRIFKMKSDEREIRREILRTFGMLGEGEILFELEVDSG